MLTRLKAFFDDRLGLDHSLRATLDRPVPGGASLANSFVVIALVLFLVELFTGAAMATVYAPSAQSAWSSVHFLQYRLHWGPLVRGLHHWAAQAMLVVLGCHVAQAVLFGAYKRPREFNWWIGLALFAVAFGAAHTGAILPWDQRGYWITRVEAEITGGMPGAGAFGRRVLLGGSDLGTLTLTRLYALHVALLPLLGVLAFWAYGALQRRHGIAPERGAPGDALPPNATEADVDAARARGVKIGSYWPDQAALDAMASLLVVAVVFYLARTLGIALDAPADPDGDYPARPEWYLLWLFKLRKYFPPSMEIFATAVVPAIAVGYIFALPLIDRSPSRSLRRRIPAVAGALIVCLGIGALTLASVRHDADDAPLQRARQLATRRAARAVELARNGVPLEGPLDMVRNDPRVRPRQIFEEQCGSCHAAPGARIREADGTRTAARGPTLAGFGSRDWARALLVNPNADDLFGRTEIHGMPPQAERLGPDGMNAMVEYLYAQSVEPGDPPADTALAARGSEAFHARCTRCHQGADDTSETPSGDRTAPDLTGWGSREWILQQVRRPDSPYHYGADNRMPPFADELRGRELEWVVNYVRGLRSERAPAPQAPPPRAPEPEAAPDPAAATGDGGT